MKEIQDVSLQSLFLEIETRHGKKEAEYLRNFYQSISGSYHALALLEEAEKHGKKLSVREAARLSGVSHIAVLKLKQRIKARIKSEQARTRLREGEAK